MNAKALILTIGAFLLVPAANAVDDIDFAMQMLSPQTSTMDVGLQDAELMTAYMETMSAAVFASGEVQHKSWYDGKGVHHQVFTSLVGVQIPSKLPGFMTLEDALEADVRVRIATNGVDVTECRLPLEKILSRSEVYFSVALIAADDEIWPNRGICDVDLNTPGIQVGIPMMHTKDVLKAYVNGEPYGEIQFLEGYCY